MIFDRLLKAARAKPVAESGDDDLSGLHDALTAAIRQGHADEAFRIASEASRSPKGGEWFACRLAELKCDIGDFDFVTRMAEAGHPIFLNNDGKQVLARAMIALGDPNADDLVLDILMRSKTAAALRLLRTLPPSELLLDRACAAFQRSPRTSYLKAVQAAHLIDMAASLGDAQRGFLISRRSLEWLDGSQREPVDFKKRDLSAELDEALSDFHDILPEGHDVFLISGTLLGVMRDGRLLPYDDDIDVGTFSKINLSKLEEAVQKSFMFSKDIATNISGLKVKHRNGTVIDVFFHESDGANLWHGGPVHVWRNTRWWNDESEGRFSSVSYAGKDYLIPKDWSGYLHDNYGEWAIPVKEYNASVEAPNLKILDFDLDKLFQQKTIIRHYHRGQFVFLKGDIARYKMKFGEDAYIADAERILLGF